MYRILISYGDQSKIRYFQEHIIPITFSDSDIVLENLKSLQEHNDLYKMYMTSNVLSQDWRDRFKKEWFVNSECSSIILKGDGGVKHAIHSFWCSKDINVKSFKFISKKLILKNKLLNKLYNVTKSY